MPREMTKKSVSILNRGLELINSVDYPVSARWLFYRLLQEGYYKGKSDYNTKLIPLLSKARKQFLFDWHPSILSDDTRARVTRVGGAENVQQCIYSLADNMTYSVHFSVDHFYQQDQYIEIWFEAKAMAGQFRHYTNYIDLVPFGGYASIPYKWDIAKHLDSMARRYESPITILYFGDLDYHGHTILNASTNDIIQWCNGVGWQVKWCGLTEEQASTYNVPENPDKPGEFQWEALDDEAAGEIITSAVAEHVDLELIDKINQEAQEQQSIWQGKVNEALAGLFDDIDYY